MRTGKDRNWVETMNVPVNIGDSRVAPGDIVRGDADGVLVIPSARESRVLDLAEEIHRAEERIRAAVRGGMRLDDARKAMRYHKLHGRERT